MAQGVDLSVGPKNLIKFEKIWGGTFLEKKGNGTENLQNSCCLGLFSRPKLSPKRIMVSPPPSKPPQNGIWKPYGPLF